MRKSSPIRRSTSSPLTGSMSSLACRASFRNCGSLRVLRKATRSVAVRAAPSSARRPRHATRARVPRVGPVVLSSRPGRCQRTPEEVPMARSGYRIFDADTHVIEPAEPIEAYLSAADRAKLAALGAQVGRAQGKAGMSRYRVGKRPDLNRMLGSRDRVPPADSVAKGLKDGGTPWDVRWQGPPFPDDRVNFDSHAR